MSVKPAIMDPTPDRDMEMAVLRTALLNVATHLGLSRKKLCLIIGISTASASRLYDGTKLIDPQSKEGELALLLIRLYRSLHTVMGGNHEQCRLWLSHYNNHLQGKPAELATHIEGLVQIISYLDAMRAKV